MSQKYGFKSRYRKDINLPKQICTSNIVGLNDSWKYFPLKLNINISHFSKTRFWWWTDFKNRVYIRTCSEYWKLMTLLYPHSRIEVKLAFSLSISLSVCPLVCFFNQQIFLSHFSHVLLTWITSYLRVEGCDHFSDLLDTYFLCWYFFFLYAK